MDDNDRSRQFTSIVYHLSIHFCLSSSARAKEWLLSSFHRLDISPNTVFYHFHEASFNALRLSALQQLSLSDELIFPP
jgi:hypothetical protein